MVRALSGAAPGSAAPPAAGPAGGSGRVVIVDPAWASDVGHHLDVNVALVEALAGRNGPVEVWADQDLAPVAGLEGRLRRPFQQCGYEDPRHWSDLGGCLHLARRCEQQLVAEAAAGATVRAWVVHTALPFQLLGLARALQHQRPALVIVSLMFPPDEVLEGTGASASAEATTRLALAGLARAIEEGGHRLVLELPSRQGEELYAPLLAAVGLRSSGVHPAVVGAGFRHRLEEGTGRQVLLHAGDLKPGKGRAEALAVVADLLAPAEPPPALADATWVFQLHSREPLPEPERILLERASAQLPSFLWVQERLERTRLLELLARCEAALLAYDPVLYRHRSSGLLWSYGAARQAAGRRAVVVGHGGSWLEREARDLGLLWHSSQDGRWLETLAEAVEGARMTVTAWNAYGQRVLGSSYGEHVAQLIEREGSGAP